MSYIKDLKKQIRQALKAEGYNSRKVSVRENPGGLSYSLTLTIKDETVERAKVEEIANNAKSVQRCPVSGDILGGGNTFVFVQRG
jgi:organic hydroperoxide reductase OsmC/OhrA